MTRLQVMEACAAWWARETGEEREWASMKVLVDECPVDLSGPGARFRFQ